MHVPGRLLGAHAPLWLTLGLVALLERLITVEWSKPYCMDPTDGPAFAATGIPLPYETYGGASSLEFLFMPHIYALNLAVLSLIVYPAVRRAFNSRFMSKTKSRRVRIGAAGAVSAFLVLAWVVSCVHVGWLRPVSSIGDDRYGRWAEFRPVGVKWSFGQSNACTPSSYWFP